MLEKIWTELRFMIHMLVCGRCRPNPFFICKKGHTLLDSWKEARE